MAYILTVVLVSFVTGGGDVSAGGVVGTFFLQMILGAALGYGFGRAIVWIINKINIRSNQSLYSVLLLACVFFTFSVTTMVYGNGYLAVYIAGLVVGNKKIVHRNMLRIFFDSFTWLLQIILFLVLGLIVNVHEVLTYDVLVLGGLVGLFMIFFARPVATFVSLAPFRNFSTKARVYVSWVGLRGAVPIIFATYPVIAQVDGSKQIFNIVFFITLLSLVIQGMSITQMARWLKLDLPAEKEGNDFGVELPDEIDSQLSDMTLVAEDLAGGNRLVDLHLPKGQLVMIVKRGSEFLIPNGQMELKVGDKLLLITEGKNEKCPS
jgi:cell volume regulation protein A